MKHSELFATVRSAIEQTHDLKADTWNAAYQALRGIEEQLEALEASNAAAGTLAGMFSVVAHEARAYCEELNREGSASTDALEAALRVAYPASEPTPLQRAYGGKVRTVSTDASNQESKP